MANHSDFKYLDIDEITSVFEAICKLPVTQDTKPTFVSMIDELQRRRVSNVLLEKRDLLIHKIQTKIDSL